MITRAHDVADAQRMRMPRHLANQAIVRSTTHLRALYRSGRGGRSSRIMAMCGSYSWSMVASQPVSLS